MHREHRAVIRDRVWNGHQAAQAQTGQRGNGLGQFHQLVRCHPRLRLAAIDVDLQAHLQIGQMLGTLLA